MVVKIENLVKRYGDLIAVDHFILEIESGSGWCAGQHHCRRGLQD